MRRVATLHIDAENAEFSTDAKDVQGGGLVAPPELRDMSEEQYLGGCKLLLAVSKNDVTRVRELLQAGVSINFRDYDRRSALHVACSEGHLGLARMLVQEGAKPHRLDRWGGTCLDDAHRHRHELVCEWLRQDIGMRAHGPGDPIGLIVAASKGDLAEVKSLVESDGIDVNSSAFDGRTALHLAANEGRLEVVNYLLSAKANPNVVDRWGGHPLDDAIRHNHKECVAVIEQHGGVRGPGVTRSKSRELTSSPPADQLMSLIVDWREVNLLEKIGSGGFGDIFRATWRGTTVACKMIRSDMIEKEKEAAIADFRIEVRLLQQLRHPNVCMLLGYSTTKDHEVMISELMRCSLLDVLRTANVADNKPAISRRRSIRYAVQLSQGMNYLHTFKPPIMHRDLKPANLLIDFSGVLKVSDFGLAKLRPAPTKSKDPNKVFMTGETGSYRFMAPEVFRHEEYDESVDVYSFSMIFYYMLRGQPPFMSLGGVDAAVAAALRHERPPIPRAWDVTLTRLLQNCWSDSGSTRPTFEKVLTILRQYYVDTWKTSIEDDLANEAKTSASKNGDCVIS